jgi:hypothetical protein
MPLKRAIKIRAGILSIAAPIVYMVISHIVWEKNRNAKLRMALKHGGFWAGMAGTVYMVHRYAFRAKNPAKAIALFAVAPIFPVIGYEVMKRIGRKLFPKQISVETKTKSSQILDLPVKIEPKQITIPEKVNSPTPISQYLVTYAQQPASYTYGTPYSYYYPSYYNHYYMGNRTW